MRILDRTTKLLLSALVIGVWCLFAQAVFQIFPVAAESAGEKPQILRARLGHR